MSELDQILSTANSENSSTESEVLTQSSGGLTSESSLVFQKPRIYKQNFTNLNPSSTSFKTSDVLNSIPTDFFDKKPDPVAGSIITGTDINGLPVVVMLSEKDDIYDPNVDSLNVPSNPDRRFSGYSLDATVITQKPAGSIGNLRSPDNSVVVETNTELDADGNEVAFNDFYATTINNITISAGANNILMVSDDNSITIKTLGKRIDFKANLPKVESPNNSIKVDVNQGANKIDLEGFTLNGLGLNVGLSSNDGSIGFSTLGNDISIKGVTVNGISGGSANNNVNIVGDPASNISVKTVGNEITIENDLDISSPNNSINVVKNNNNYELTGLSINGIKAENVLIGGAKGTKVDTVGNTITISSEGIPEGYKEHQISLCINGQPHTAFMLLKDLQPA